MHHVKMSFSAQKTLKALIKLKLIVIKTNDTTNAKCRLQMNKRRKIPHKNPNLHGTTRFFKA